MADVEPADLEKNVIYQLFLKQLHPLLIEHGFCLIKNSAIEASAHRYKVAYCKQRVDAYGEVTDHLVDLIGIPMGSVLILCYGIVHGADETDDLEVKIKVKSSETLDDVKRRFKNEFIFKLLELLGPKLNDLPSEIKLRVLGYLDAPSLSRLSRTSREWHEFVDNENTTWKRLFNYRYPQEVAHPIAEETWRDLYKDTTIRKKREKEVSDRWANRGLPSPPLYPMLPGIPPAMPFPPPFFGPNPDFPDEPFYPPFGQPFPRPPGPNDMFRPRGPPGGFFGGF